MSHAAQVNQKRPFKLNQEFISPFLGATKNVFTTMVHLSPSAQAPMLWKKPLPVGDVASVIPLTCTQITGQLTVAFQNENLKTVASKMLMEEFTEVNAMVLDVAGEITNMIAGGAKVELGQRGFDFGMATPQTLKASDFNKMSLLGEPRIVIPYQIDTSLFYIDLGFVES